MAQRVAFKHGMKRKGGDPLHGFSLAGGFAFVGHYAGHGHAKRPDGEGDSKRFQNIGLNTVQEAESISARTLTEVRQNAGDCMRCAQALRLVAEGQNIGIRIVRTIRKHTKYTCYSSG